MNTVIQPKKSTALFVVSILFACFAYSLTAQAAPAPNTPDPGSVGGVFNTADGFKAMPLMSAGTANSAFGAFALFSAVSCNFNTAVGGGALLNNSVDGNTAVGAVALLNNTTATGNTAVGATALLFNVTGPGNTAVGAETLFSNTGDNSDPPNGRLNTAVGLDALYSNTTGNSNTAVGAGTSHPNPEGGPAPLGSNTTGSFNTAVGAGSAGPAALGSNITGAFNTAIGQGALGNNTAGNSNIGVGASAGADLTTGDNNIDIGNDGVAAEANTIRIGTTGTQTATYIAAIRDTTTGMGDAIPVVIDSAGQLGTMSSSARFKKDIKPMDKTSEAILSLKPVSFQYKSDSKGTSQFGLIAEEVAKVNPDLVVRDRNGNIYSVRYEAVNAMLLNEFLKEHKKVEQQQAVISQLESTVVKQEANAAGQQKEIETLTAGLQRVTAQLELSKAAPQTVLNNQ
jgi:hypothetical protein